MVWHCQLRLIIFAASKEMNFKISMHHLGAFTYQDHGVHP